MKHGRVIKLRSESLRRLRASLRKFLVLALDDQFNRSVDQGYLQDSVGNFIGVQKIDQEVRLMDDLFQFSICRCRRCRDTEKDAVFWDGEVDDQFIYPPYSSAEKVELSTPSYWLCPECYKWQTENYKRLRKDRFYIFREYNFSATLGELGIDKAEDIDKVVDEERKYFDEDYYEAEDRLHRRTEI